MVIELACFFLRVLFVMNVHTLRYGIELKMSDRAVKDVMHVNKKYGLKEICVMFCFMLFCFSFYSLPTKIIPFPCLS
jgi:hypothetical protein